MKYFKPQFSEKTLKLSENNWYSFKVIKSLKKNDFKKLISEKYKVKPIAINSVTYKSLIKKRGRNIATSQGYKIFRVKLPKDSKIAGFEIGK